MWILFNRIAYDKFREEAMNNQTTSGSIIRANVTGPISGQVAIGNNIHQAQSINAWRPEVSSAELAELRQTLTDLRAQVAAHGSADKQTAALTHVDELEAAITATEPDLDTMGYIKRWFTLNLPQLAGAVTGIIVHPIVGKLVEAAGDALAAEFRHRFGNR
jgi:hypothetical protein